MEELRLRNSSFKSFSAPAKILGKHTFSAVSSFFRELKPVYKDSRFQRIVWLGLFNFLSLLLLLTWCNITESVGLQSFMCIIYFDTLCLCICGLSIWVEQKKPNSQYSFGYERFEVLALFLSTTYTLIDSIFIIKKGIWRWFGNAEIFHTGLLFPGIFLSFICHMLIMFFMKNKALNLVICASSSSWVQIRMSTFKQSLSHVVPTKAANPRPHINPLSLLGCATGGLLVLMVCFIDIFGYHNADAVAGIAVCLVICVTMYPLSAYCGKILLQGTPAHVKDLLDKCLREVSTLDGVLEFRNEHFYLLGFDKIVGTLHVRIRRDANEQIVLSHLLNKLSSLVADITIQIFKDEWTWNSGATRLINDPYLKFPPPKSEGYTLPNQTLTPKIAETQVTLTHLTPPLPPALTAMPPYAPTTTKSITKTSGTVTIDLAAKEFNRELTINPIFRHDKT